MQSTAAVRVVSASVRRPFQLRSSHPVLGVSSLAGSNRSLELPVSLRRLFVELMKHPDIEVQEAIERSRVSRIERLGVLDERCQLCLVLHRVTEKLRDKMRPRRLNADLSQLNDLRLARNQFVD